VVDKYSILGKNKKIQHPQGKSNMTNSKEYSDVCVTKMASFSYLL
jgi:hypothetical protein